MQKDDEVQETEKSEYLVSITLASLHVLPLYIAADPRSAPA